jgi:hypothetical protein
VNYSANPLVRLRATSIGAVQGWASPQRLSAAFTVLIVIVAGYSLARSLAVAV